MHKRVAQFCKREDKRVFGSRRAAEACRRSVGCFEQFPYRCVRHRGWHLGRLD
jgi:hypothetical protein